MEGKIAESENNEQHKTKIIQIFNRRNLKLVISAVTLIVVVYVTWSSQINPRGDAFWGGIRFLFFVASGIIFTILMTSYFVIMKARLKFVSFILSLFLSATFFILCILLTNFLGYHFNYFLVQTKQNKIEKNIGEIVTLEHYSSTNRELFQANDIFIKAEKEKQIQYYYLNNSSELVEIKSLKDKDIVAYEQSPTLSPQKEKMALFMNENQLYIYDKSQNNTWIVNIDPNYSYLYYRNFFFNKNEELIFSLSANKLGDFSMNGRIDFINNTMKFSRSEELGDILYPENPNNSCVNIKEIDMQPRSYASLQNNSCLYVASSYSEQEQKLIYTLNLYDIPSNSTKTLLENEYKNIDIINIIYISI